MTAAANSQALARGDRVLWYEIEAILGQGGFGITYRAHDTNLDRTVAIKEYLPAMFATRGPDGIIAPTGSDQKADYEWGLARFIDEGRTLARFDHPGIVRVFSVFETNGTAYLVMRFEQGEALDSILKRTTTLPETQLKKILFDVMDGLMPVHEAGFIHRDIKPANIYIREDGSAVLIDFGSARQALGIQTQTLTTLVSPGYAPFEQYSSDSAQQGPWTDIYALGATAYRAMTGRAPVTAVDRSRALLTSTPDRTLDALRSAGGYSSAFFHAIERAIAFHEQDRPQSIADWRERFAGEASDASRGRARATVLPTADAEPGATEIATERLHPAPTVRPAETEFVTEIANPSPPASRKNGLVIAGAFVLLIMIVLWRPWHGGESPARTPITAGVPATASSSVRTENFATENGRVDDGAGVASNLDPAVQALLDAARTHAAAGRLTRPAGRNALENFRAVLDHDPFNDDAQAGIEAVVQDRLGRARQALREQDYLLARTYIEEAALADPAHHDVLMARAELPQQPGARISVASETPVVRPVTPPPPTATETIIGAAAKLAEPENRKQLRRVKKSLEQQDYRKALKHLGKGWQ